MIMRFRRAERPDIELAPHIDARYRAADFRLLVGHSSGGLFTLHALLSRPDAFHASIASSPSLWWDEECARNHMNMRLRWDRPHGDNEAHPLPWRLI